MKVITNVKAGGGSLNHNHAAVCGLKIKTNVKAGGLSDNHNQMMARPLKVKTGIKAGITPGDGDKGSAGAK